MELSVRLQAVADMVPRGSTVADIGCDHGYVSIYLCRKKQCPRVIAMDIHRGPLQRAEANIARYGLKDYIQLRLSDGADALQRGEVELLLLSGMGGRLTIRILERGLSRLGPLPWLVLQPQSEIFLVRAFLRQQGYTIVDENMVLDEGKFYPVIKAQTGCSGQAGSDGAYRQIVEDYFGPVLLHKRPREFEAFLEKEEGKITRLLSQVSQPQRVKELQEYLSYVREAEKGRMEKE